MRLRRLGALTCKVIGFGRIGRETARKPDAFGCRVLAHDPAPPAEHEDVTFTDLDTLLGEPPRHPRNSPSAGSTAARNEVTA